MNNLLIFLWMVAVIGFASATDYCSDSICGPGLTHIACNHPGDFSESCSDNAALVCVCECLKDIILNTHNSKRNSIAGGEDKNIHEPACRMATMEWDDELAEYAALNVKQCEMKHDECHNTYEFQNSGQSLAWLSFTEQVNHSSMFLKAMNFWYDKIELSKMEYIKSFPQTDLPVAEFLIMVTDRNIRVGCAAATYTPVDANYNAYLIACNYATISIVGVPVYDTCDKPAISCTSGVNPIYSNLCSTSEVYNLNKFS